MAGGFSRPARGSTGRPRRRRASPKLSATRTFQGTQRSTFVIGADGALTYAEYDVDARGHVARLRTHLLP